MPLESYTYMHSEADLTAEQREILIEYFKNLQAKYKTSSQSISTVKYFTSSVKNTTPLMKD